MTEHLSTEIVERFHQQALAAGDRSLIYDHAVKCEACRKQIVDSGIEALALEALSGHLLPGSEHDHLDYETIELYVDEGLDKADRYEVDKHLEVCHQCSSEVTDLRESLATMSAPSIRQQEKAAPLLDRIRSFARVPAFSRPLQVSAVIALGAFAVIAVVVVWRLKSGGPTPVPAGGRDISAGSVPTPGQSPLKAQPGSSPLPTPGASPHKTLEPTPWKRPTEPAQEMVALNDGPNRITLDKSGKLIGLESLPREMQQAVREVLTTQTIKRPDVLNELTATEVSLRAPAGKEETVRIVYPSKTVITEDRPRLEWVPSKTANGYRVEIGDAQFHQVAKSEELPSTARAWRPPAPLKRGVVYTWVVRIIRERPEGNSLASQGKFKILEDEKLKELTRLRTAPQSRLALGVFYAREGMVAEAENEFQIIVKDNPRSVVARRLLKQLQSW